LLDEKIKSIARGGGGGGGGLGGAGAGAGLGAGVLEDLEAVVAALRADVDSHKSSYERDQAKVRDELA